MYIILKDSYGISSISEIYNFTRKQKGDKEIVKDRKTKNEYVLKETAFESVELANIALLKQLELDVRTLEDSISQKTINLKEL